MKVPFPCTCLSCSHQSGHKPVRACSRTSVYASLRHHPGPTYRPLPVTLELSHRVDVRYSVERTPTDRMMYDPARHPQMSCLFTFGWLLEVIPGMGMTLDSFARYHLIIHISTEGASGAKGHIVHTGNSRLPNPQCHRAPIMVVWTLCYTRRSASVYPLYVPYHVRATKAFGQRNLNLYLMIWDSYP